MTQYHAAPAFRSFAPGRAFGSREEAERWAQAAARAYRTPYAVWQRDGARLKLLRQLPAPTPAA
jgi:hypothetical protein